MKSVWGKVGTTNRRIQVGRGIASETRRVKNGKARVRLRLLRLR